MEGDADIDWFRPPYERCWAEDSGFDLRPYKEPKAWTEDPMECYSDQECFALQSIKASAPETPPNA